MSDGVPSQQAQISALQTEVGRLDGMIRVMRSEVAAMKLLTLHLRPKRPDIVDRRTEDKGRHPVIVHATTARRKLDKYD